MMLETFFHENSRVALAFSGGVDSAYLLYAARACGAQVLAYYFQTAFQPAFEREDALRLARELDTGCVYINNFYRLGAQCVPFGGNKASGFGRERCADTLKEFSRPKTVRIPSGLGKIPTWSLDR